MKSLDDVLEELLEHRRSLNFSKQTLKTLKSRAQTFIKFVEGRYSKATADEVTRSCLQAYQKYLPTMTSTKGKAKGIPLKANSINNLITAVHVLLDFMADRGYTAPKLKKHLERVKQPKLLPTSVLNHDQVKQMIEGIDISSAEGIRDRAILELVYSSGIRGGELEGLILDNVDLKLGVMRVIGKGRKERVVPIGKTALKCLKNYIVGVRSLVPGNEKHRHVFLNQRGLPYRIKQLQQLTMRSAENVSLNVNVTPHTLRRSCTTELIRGDANMYHVKELLGHESIDTLKVYTKLTINDLKKTHAKCHPRERSDI